MAVTSPTEPAQRADIRTVNTVPDSTSGLRDTRPVLDPGEPRAARTVVFLHGQPGAASDWDSVVAALPVGLRTLALDRPGYRSSPHPPGSFRANASWLLNELDRARIEDPILVGHSYGGAVAMTTAALASDRIAGLVLVSSVGPGCLDGWDRLLAAPVAGPICAVAAWWLTPWFARKRVARIERLTERPLLPHEHLNWEVWGNARHDHGAMWRTLLTEERELVHGVDGLNADIRRVTVPTIVIADPADKMVPVSTARALHAAVPGSRLVLVAEGGHHLPRRIPVILANEISAFANSLQ